MTQQPTNSCPFCPLWSGRNMSTTSPVSYFFTIDDTGICLNVSSDTPVQPNYWNNGIVNRTLYLANTGYCDYLVEIAEDLEEDGLRDIAVDLLAKNAPKLAKALHLCSSCAAQFINDMVDNTDALVEVLMEYILDCYY